MANIAPPVPEVAEEGVKKPETDTSELQKTTEALEKATAEVKASLDPAKQAIIVALKELSIPCKESDSLETLTKKLINRTTVLANNEKVKDLPKAELLRREYARNTNLSNKTFIDRLFKLNIPEFYVNAIEEVVNGRVNYLYLLSDLDNNLSDEQLLKKIASSRVSHIDPSAAAAAIALRHKASLKPHGS